MSDDTTLCDSVSQRLSALRSGLAYKKSRLPDIRERVIGPTFSEHAVLSDNLRAMLNRIRQELNVQESGGSAPATVSPEPSLPRHAGKTNVPQI